MNKIVTLIFFCFFSLLGVAQNDGPVMADHMRESGKIYVVIGVIAVIFISIVVFLVFIERRLARLEKKIAAGGHNKEIQ